MRVCHLGAGPRARETPDVIKELTMIRQAATTTSPQSRTAIDHHRRQRDLVRASLIACPVNASPTHRRWA